MAAKKLCDADEQHLLCVVVDAIAERKSLRQIMEIAARVVEQEFKVSMDRTTLRRYVQAAQDEYNSPYKQVRKTQKDKAIRRLDTLYKRCVANGDLSTALKIEKELSVLRGIYQDLGNEHEQTINIVFKDASKEDIDKNGENNQG